MTEGLVPIRDCEQRKRCVVWPMIIFLWQTPRYHSYLKKKKKKAHDIILCFLFRPTLSIVTCLYAYAHVNIDTIYHIYIYIFHMGSNYLSYLTLVFIWYIYITPFHILNVDINRNCLYYKCSDIYILNTILRFKYGY